MTAPRDTGPEHRTLGGDGARRLRRLWSGDRDPATVALSLLAAPLSAVFGTAVRARNVLYDLGVLGTTKVPVPVISVGNLAVGGTGKTPVVRWLVDHLAKNGWRPAVVLRGYGEDEIRLHERWYSEVPVVACPDRRKGIARATEAGADIVVLDDGFQHRRMGRDLDLLLLSPAHPLPVRLLPRGPYREPLRSIRRADRVLVTAKGSHEASGAAALAREVSRAPGAPPVDLFTLTPGAWETLDGAPAPQPAGPPLVVCSVAEPEGFARSVESRVGEAPDTLTFQDHHAYGPQDAQRVADLAGGRWIATTEKDAVKLLPLRELLPEVRVLPLVPVPGERLAKAVTERVGTPRGTHAPSPDGLSR